MKKLTLVVLAVVAFFVACQKEVSSVKDAKNPVKSGVVTTSQIPGITFFKRWISISKHY